MYTAEANGKIQILENSLELMEILVKYTSVLTPTAAANIVAPADAVSLGELFWGSFDYDSDRDDDWDDDRYYEE